MNRINLDLTTRVVQIALRLALAAAFLSSVADRFGWWGQVGEGNVGWGNIANFADNTHQLVPFVSGWLLMVLVWLVTASEIALAVLLLSGLWPTYVGAAACFELMVYAIAMFVQGPETPFSYSVPSAACAAAAYALISELAPRRAGRKDQQSAKVSAG